ncbi:MAG: hypothetical protein R6T83_09305 [Salinibacter sp.]
MAWDRRREAEAEEGATRRTVPLEDDGNPSYYKGEDNLRQLDTPAYERRSTPPNTDEPEAPAEHDEVDERDEADDEADDDTSASSGNVRRLRADDLDDRTDRGERDRSDDAGEDDTDTPAFLRKMMD